MQTRIKILHNITNFNQLINQQNQMRMKKSLLLGVALMGSVCAFAQDGVDITPANYHFNTAKVAVPWLPGYCTDPNIKAGSTDVWGEMSFGDYYNDGLFVDASAGQNEKQQEAFKNAWSLVNFGGDVGQVLCYAGQNSGIVDYLTEEYPDLSEQWQKIKVNTLESKGFNMHIVLGKDSPGFGYIHFKMLCNVFSNNMNGNTKVWQNFYATSNTNTVWPGWNASSNFPFTEGDCIERYYDDGFIGDGSEDPVEYENPETGEWDTYKWDPKNWKVVEFDFPVPGDWPARIRFQAQGNNAWDNYAFFVKDIELTYFAGEEGSFDNSKHNYNTRYAYFDNVMTKPSAIETIETENNSPVEFYNLQGVKVSNPENGIFIKKQGNKTTKVVVK